MIPFREKQEIIDHRSGPWCDQLESGCGRYEHPIAKPLRIFFHLHNHTIYPITKHFICGTTCSIPTSVHRQSLYLQNNAFYTVYGNSGCRTSFNLMMFNFILLCNNTVLLYILLCVFQRAAEHCIVSLYYCFIIH